MHVYHASFNHDIPVVPTRKTHSSSSVTETQRSTPRFSRGKQIPDHSKSATDKITFGLGCCLRRELARFWNRAIDKESNEDWDGSLWSDHRCVFQVDWFKLHPSVQSDGDKQIRGCALVHHSRCPDTKTLLMLFIICICAYDWVLFKQPLSEFHIHIVL